MYGSGLLKARIARALKHKKHAVQMNTSNQMTSRGKFMLVLYQLFLRFSRTISQRFVNIPCRVLISELPRIHLLGTRVNSALSRRTRSPVPATSMNEAVFYRWLKRIVDCKRGRASAAKRQPRREVGTQNYGPQL